MRNHKRFIALILVAVMAFSGAVMSASAAKLTDADKYPLKGALTKVTLAYAIDVLQQLGVVAGVSNVTGDDGKVTEYTFDGDSLVTRQQFALFTARISTARPNLFVVDPASEMKTNTKFKDLVDKVYTLAIDHCYGEGYILGRDEENTIFDPKGNITFAEAVTMLTRALGYTGLVYPTGFMTKASEGGVGIKEPIALIGEYADFPMADVALNTPITRSQMAMLLWNYLLSQKYELEMVYNGAKGQWDAERVPHAILEMFGIKRTIGYVTSVPNWWAELDVGNGAWDVNNAWVSAPLKGTNLQPANTQFQVYKDICISPRNGGTNIVTTMDKLGLGEYKADPLELLGLKVTVYLDSRLNPDFDINIPTIVYGKKYEIDIKDVDGAWNTGDSGKVDSLSIPFPAIEDLIMDKADFCSAYVPNLYTFDKGAVLKGVKGAEKDPDTVYLARKAANKTNYRLELVYNGDYTDGTPEYFYIFRPFQVGVYYKDPDRDNRLCFTTQVVKADPATDLYDRKIDHAANFIDEDIEELVLDKAYLYTYYGANLDIYAELTEDKGVIPTAANMTSKLVTFKLPAGGSKNVYFNHDVPKALGAWGSASPVNPDGKGVYTVYYDNEAALLARRTSDGPDEYQKSQYVLILSLSATREVTLRDPDTYSRIGQAYRALVLNAQTGKQEEIVIHLINGEEIDYGVNSNEWRALIGVPVRLANKGFDFYDVATKDNENFITHVANKEYAGYKNPGTMANLPVASNRVQLPGISWPAPSTPVFGADIFTFINANTNIVIYGPTEYKSTAITADNPTGAIYGAVRHTGNAKGLEYLKDLLASGNTDYLIAVGLGVTPTGSTSNVFLKVVPNAAGNNTISGPPAATGNYAMVLNNDGGLTSGGYYYGTARLADGTTVNVASKTASDILRGRLIEVSGDKVTAFDIEYSLATAKDSTLDFGVDPDVFGNFNSYFASPTSIPTRKVGQLDIWGNTLGAYAADYSFDLTYESFSFDKNIFKIVVGYTHETKADSTATPPVVGKIEQKLVTEGRPTKADGNVKEQFVSISQSEYQKIIDAGGEIYVVTYTAGTGSDRSVVFATMLIDLQGCKNKDGDFLAPFFWRED